MIERIIKGTIVHGNGIENLTEEEKEIAEIKKTGIRKKVDCDEYEPTNDCQTCMYWNEETDECTENAEYFYHDQNESQLDCDKYVYIYELK